MSRLIRLLLLSLFCLFIVAGPAPAQSQAPAADPAVDAKQVNALIQTLEDPAKRDALLAQLKALQAVEQKRQGAEAPASSLGSRFLSTLSDRVEEVSQQIAEAGRAVIDTPHALRWLNQQVADPVKRDNWLRLALHLAAIIGAGYAARWIAIWLLRRPRNALGARNGIHWWTKLPLLTVRLLIDLLPMAAFALAGFGVLSASEAPRAVRLASLTILNASLIVQGTLVITRFLLSPSTANLRLVPVSDETAHYLLIWVRRIVIIGVYGYFIAQAALVLGLPAKPYAAGLKLVGLLVTVMLIILILQNRQSVAAWVRGDHLRPDPDHPETDPADAALQAVVAGESGGSDAELGAPAAPSAGQPAEAAVVSHTVHRGRAVKAVRRRLADVWHILAILYLSAIYFIWVLEIAGGFEFVLRATLVTGAILIGSRLLAEGLDRTMRRGFAISPELQAQFPGLENRANRYLPVLHRLLKGLLWFFTLVLLLQAWGANALGWFDTNFGQRITASAVTIFLVLTLALIAWEMVAGAIHRYLNATDDSGTAIQRSARMRTLLPLARNALMILMITMVGLIVLAELGVNIAPLLAGAGVVGLAIGFGAQTLVKDVITGLFMLIEDTLSVGDVVNVGGKGGSVEAITIRTIRLRDYDGSVHTIPFSSITTATNMTKDFSFYVLNVSIDYKEDTDRVVAVLRDIAEQMRAEPAYAAAMLAPLDVAGVDAFQDSAVVIKARLKTRPIQQWSVGREFNRRMRIRFAEEGITIPFPQRTLHLGDGATLIGPAQKAGEG
ncbi:MULTISPECIES: mechanosensitive ion channel domain-containing protein [unclassified Azospirillum]|uniref:mechanosensitive ion channel domain-containing protein n=1 Tax=unclassified Azospirillum TaxID=2630922 RepID=UPI000B6C88D9|nr:MULTISPECIES: mechanosensitive ion channel domain-containing protein [unclassified Azospirillum]SNS62966.1 small conductance mechanosensitive channel [Azospirillum sp. RU38E]SNS82102.1 small conductance mechanosensitive channel [Azospirillum sp. RU37A]